MDVFELVEKLGGEIVRDIPRYRSPEGYVVLGTRSGDGFVLTEAGRQLAAEFSRQTEPAKKKATKGLKELSEFDVTDELG